MKNHAVSILPTRRLAIQALVAMTALPNLARAQGAAQVYPNKPVRIVVPYTTGGTNDVMARLVGQKLSEAWGQPVIVDNKPGAAGNIGSAEVARAPADGYTLLLTNINVTSMNPALMTQMPFDPQKDFAPITLLGTTSMILAVNPQLPVTNIQELLKLLRSKPGNLTYASSGSGSPQHMSAEMFKAMTKTSIVHIPYRGAAPAIADVVGGQVDVIFGVANQVLPQVRAGRLRALAVTSSKRLPSAPELPTLEEAGVKSYESEIWLGIAAPANTPVAIVEKINQDIRKAMALPDVLSKLSAQGIEPLLSSPDQMRQRAAQDLQRWTSIIKTMGIRSE